MNKYLIVILGPTAVGKTNTSIELAQWLRCDIISADSRQFYREMTIGTAVPSKLQLETVRHNFIHHISVTDYYSSSIFEQEVIAHLSDWYLNHDIALMTGGSGMYIDAVCEGTDDIPDVDPEIRESYIVKLKKEGIESLRMELKRVDPAHYSTADLKNPQRLLRALEITASTGRPYSSFLLNQKKGRPFSVIKIGLTLPREELYSKINMRVDTMLEEGLEAEAYSLRHLRHHNALNTVGYKEFFDFFEGKISRDEAIRLIKRNSRRYAKRQLTWWARDKSVIWLHPDETEKLRSLLNDKMIRPS